MNLWSREQVGQISEILSGTRDVKENTGLSLLREPQRFEFDQEGPDISKLSAPVNSVVEIIDKLINITVNVENQTVKPGVFAAAPAPCKAPFLMHKEVNEKEIAEVLSRKNVAVPTQPEEYNLPLTPKTWSEPSQTTPHSWSEHPHTFSHLESFIESAQNAPTSWEKRDQSRMAEEKDQSMSDRSRKIRQKPFWNTMDRPGSPIRKMIISKYQMSRKIINSETVQMEYLNGISPSFIYFREKHHGLADFTITRHMRLKDLYLNTKLSIGSHNYSITIPNPSEPILWRYCMAPMGVDSIVRARIIDKKPMIRACEDRDPTNEYYKVFYIDYGTTGWVKKRVCFEMHNEEWFTRSPEAVGVSLYDLRPKRTKLDGAQNLEWSKKVCKVLRATMSQYKFFDVRIVNPLLRKTRSDQSHAVQVICYAEDPSKYPEYASCGVNLSHIIAFKCFDEVEIVDKFEPDAEIPKFESECKFDRNTFNLPEHLSLKPQWVNKDNVAPLHPDVAGASASSVAHLQHSQLESHLLSSPIKPRYTSVEKRINGKVPAIEIPLDVWPRGHLPWTIDSLELTGFIGNNNLYFSFDCRTPIAECFNFSAHPFNYSFMTGVVEGTKALHEKIEQMLKVRKYFDASLMSFYHNADNRRLFNWEYVQGKLDRCEPVNCVVGIIDNNDDDRFKCHRARILYLIESFADEFKNLRDGIEAKSKKFVNHVILELYDYGGVMAVSTESICQMHPMHDTISPFTIRMALDVDIGQQKGLKFEDLVRVLDESVYQRRKALSNSICNSTPKKVTIVDGPRKNEQKMYKFEHFLFPWTDPFIFKIKDIESYRGKERSRATNGLMERLATGEKRIR
uniref:Tudor domain-containing protein n=1 Tax=Rhabditophanes sp. KR3021 TaxID=114890 RepID=A0AC35UE36_9BILA